MSISLAFCFCFIAAVKCKYLIAQAHRRIPGDGDGSFDTFMGRAPLRMHSYGAYRSFTSFRWDSEIIVDSDGFYANGLSVSGNTTIDSSGIGLAVETNLAP